MRMSKELYNIGIALASRLGIYRLYEWALERAVIEREVPSHVGLILDGNRRWAEEKRMPRWLGHRYGADKLEEALRWLLKLNVKIITVYVLSIDNIRERPIEELKNIYDLIIERARSLKADPLIHGNKVRVRIIGERGLLPADVRSALKELEDVTRGYDEHHLNVAVAYGGRYEIVQAARKAAELVLEGEVSPGEIDDGLLSKLMYTGQLPNPDPDLIIRTSGEVRLSGFLIWQSAYSELVFLDVYWPEFRYIDLLRAIRTYQRRNRRFGR